VAKTQERASNDNTPLVPRTSFDAPILEFDFPGLKVGVAEYEDGPTGCTVFYFPRGVATAVDKRGGMVGAIEEEYGWYHAICFAGGSLYGLEAAIGVRKELLAKQAYSIDKPIPLVSGAIIWDWKGRNNTIYPDAALGRAAIKAAREGIFPLGPRGAGRSAGCGGGFNGVEAERTGQGGAFSQVGPTKIAVFTVVNALGAIVNRQSQVVRGYLDTHTGTRHHSATLVERKLAKDEPTQVPSRNTTLTLVLTNQKLDNRSLTQLARQVHSSMARAIQPFHTIRDGDILYASTTNEVENPGLNETALGILASELAWDAILRSFDEST